MKTSISTRKRNLMSNYIGKTYNCFYGWSVTIKDFMGNTGYFITEINDGVNVWQSNASYGEITSNIKKGLLLQA